jgi:hypothetical protein
MTDRDKPFEANDLPAAPVQPSTDTLTRWGDEGGSVPMPDDAGRAAAPAISPDKAPDVGEMGNAELVQLRVRVIALENMLVALLSDVSEGQIAKVRAMADHIQPRPGQTPHPLTTGAGAQMLALLHRAEHWDSGTALSG